MKKLLLFSIIASSFVAQSFAAVTAVKTQKDLDGKIGKGKITVVKFFSPWCGACKGIAQPYKNLSNKYADVIFLEVDATASKISSGSNYVPFFKVFDKEGNKVLAGLGAKQLKQIEQTINKNK